MAVMQTILSAISQMQTRLSASRPLDMTGSENYIPALESTGSDLYRDSDRAV